MDIYIYIYIYISGFPSWCIVMRGQNSGYYPGDQIHKIVFTPTTTGRKT